MIDTKNEPDAVLHTVSNVLASSSQHRMTEDIAIQTPAASAEALLAMEDAEFVSSAYLSVLGRPADPVGFADYLRHIRAGASKSDILAALATSPEAKRLDPDRISGLARIVREAKRIRVPFFSRRTFKRVIRRVEVCEYRISKMEQSFAARLEKLESELGALLHGHRRQMQGGALSPVILDPELRLKLREMSLHARSLYFQLEEAVKEHLRTSMP